MERALRTLWGKKGQLGNTNMSMYGMTGEADLEGGAEEWERPTPPGLLSDIMKSQIHPGDEEKVDSPYPGWAAMDIEKSGSI